MDEKRGLFTSNKRITLLTIILVPLISTIIIWKIAKWFMPFIVFNFNTALICALALGLVYFVLGVLIKKCNNEKIIHLVICMMPAYLVGLFSLGFGLTIVFRFIWAEEYYNDVAGSTYYWGFLISLLLSAIIYLVCEFISEKSLSSVLRSVKYVPILWAATIISGILLFVGINASIHKEVNADKIKYVIISGEVISAPDKYDEKVKLVDEELFKIVEFAYEYQLDNYLRGTDDELYYCGSEHGRIIHGKPVGINQGGVTFYRIIEFDMEMVAYIESLYTYEIYEKDGKYELPEYETFDQELSDDDLTDQELPDGYSSNIELSITGLSDLNFDKKEFYNILKEDLQNTPYSQIRDVGEDEILCYAKIGFYGEGGGGNIRSKIPISNKTPKTYEYIMNKIEKIDNGQLALYMDEIRTAKNEIYNCSFICVDGDKVIVPGRDYAVTISNIDKFCKLMERLLNEQGDTFIYMEGHIELENREVDYVISKRVPKDLADEICKLVD